MTRQFQGVLLAGGRSRRFGSPKAFAEKDGEPFYHYAIAALEPFVAATLIVTRPELQHRFKQEHDGTEVVCDPEEYQGQGPLAGIYRAMEAAHAEWYMVLPVDVPFIKQDVIETLTRYTDTDADAIIPIVSGRIQPLIAIYRSTIKERINYQLDHGERSVYQLLKSCRIHYVTMTDDEAFANINRPSDYQTWIKEEDQHVK